MKKLLICMVMATMAVCANAQITWNVRAGAGIQGFVCDEYGSTHEMSIALLAQTNIPLKKASPFTFSPSISISAPVEFENLNVTLPLLFGYKIPMGNNTLFIPKVGPMIGTNTYNGEFLFGPSIELPFEINRVVLAINGNFSVIEDFLIGAYLTVGYKF